MIKSVSRGAVGLLVAAIMSVVALGLLGLAAPAMAETCPNEEFRTGASANLPDCRAYEQVTPPFKEAALPEFEAQAVIGGYTGMSADGSHLAIASVGNFGDAHTSVGANSYELTRTGSGWSEANIDLSASLFPYSKPLRTTPDFEKVLYVARATQEPLTNYDFLIGEADGTLHDLGSVLPPSAALGPPGLGFPVRTEGSGLEGASADLSHVVFSANVPWPGDGSSSLYEYVSGQSGPPIPIGVDPSGVQCPAQAVRGRGAVSADGSVVYFKIGADQCSPGNPAVSEIFARIDATRTVAISEPSSVDCTTCNTTPGVLEKASFMAASADGSKAFFTTTQPLLGNDTSTNIYEYDSGNPDGQKLIQVTGGVWSAGGAQVAGGTGSKAVKVSEDGSHVYFLAGGILSGTVNGDGQHPIAGGENLYVFERDTRFPSGRTSFIATLSSEDFEELNQECSQCRNATVTPDGRYLVFMSHADLTADDTSAARQVFDYDAQTGDLRRVSIGQNGFNNNGNTNSFDASIPSERPNRALAVSNDGAYIVFQSADGLTPQALNGVEGEYEYESQFNGTLKEKYLAQNAYEYHDGHVYLISDGLDATQSETISSVHAVGMSPSGRDIFFTTANDLVPQDVDSAGDVYDARIGGGFPAPVSSLPVCSGDACQGELSPSPVLLSPGSEFQAGGNPPLANPVAKAKQKVKRKLKACKRGLRRRHDKCVRAKRAAVSARGRK